MSPHARADDRDTRLNPAVGSLIAEAMKARPARLGVVMQLLLWARRHYIISSKDTMWTRGCLPIQDTMHIIEVWARSSSAALSQVHM